MNNRKGEVIQRIDHQGCASVRAFGAVAQLEIQEIPIERGAAAALARLRAETGLRMPDCCVLHAALTAGAQALATRDSRLARAAATKGFQTP